MKIFITLLALIALLAFGYGCWKLERRFNWKFGYKNLDSELKVEWVGYPMFATDYKGIDPGIYGPSGPPKSQFIATEIEMGFREDGVILWRKYEKKEVK